MVTQELIDKFFRNECTRDERQLVLQYFEQHPAEWDKYLNEEDWESFKTTERLHPAVTEKIYDRVSARIFKKRRTWVAVAASVALLAGLAWWLLLQQQPTNKQTNDKTQLALNAPMRETINNTAQMMEVRLDDGTVVRISPNSSIRYHEDFYIDQKRTVYLQGQAFFKVAKDAKHPFTVHSDDIATTALGTEFTVTSFKDSHEIHVALHEGKIMVDAGKENLYLFPGDELVYNRKTMLASVNRAGKGQHLVKAGASYKKGVSIQKPTWYEFNGSPLPEVLDQLSAYYQVDIYYYPTEINSKYFVAKFRNTDSLDKILNDIALLNHLSITKQTGSYIIKKTR